MPGGGSTLACSLQVGHKLGPFGMDDLRSLFALSGSNLWFPNGHLGWS